VGLAFSDTFLLLFLDFIRSFLIQSLNDIQSLLMNSPILYNYLVPFKKNPDWCVRGLALNVVSKNNLYTLHLLLCLQAVDRNVAWL
jgi:hypothetical protein